MKHQTFYETVVHSPQWQAWKKVAEKKGFDWHESTECGWLSEKHFHAFLSWCVKNKDNKF